MRRRNNEGKYLLYDARLRIRRASLFRSGNELVCDVQKLVGLERLLKKGIGPGLLRDQSQIAMHAEIDHGYGAIDRMCF